jgi:hypothetical protein
MYLRTRNEYPFLGAVRRRAPKKKKRAKGGGRGPGAAAEPAGPEAEPEPPKERALAQAQRYFHIVGIDIILDARGHPKLLELNDRPLLQVTAPFEAALKEGMIAEAFTHRSLDGSSFGAPRARSGSRSCPCPPLGARRSGPRNHAAPERTQNEEKDRGEQPRRAADDGNWAEAGGA